MLSFGCRYTVTSISFFLTEYVFKCRHLCNKSVFAKRLLLFYAGVPVFTSPSLSVNGSFIRIPAHLPDNATLTFEYFSSFNGSLIQVYKIVNSSRQRLSAVQVDYLGISLTLTVFGNVVIANGTRAKITLLIDSIDDFSKYAIAVSNSEGESVLEAEVVLIGNDCHYYFYASTVLCLYSL